MSEQLQELPQDQEPEEQAGALEVEEAVRVEAPKIDLNTATEEELRGLPGIGPALAARIVSYRAEAGPFGSPEELTAVSGVAGTVYTNLADRLTVVPVESQVEEASDLIGPEPEPVELKADEPEESPLTMDKPQAEPEPAKAPEPKPEVRPVGDTPPRGPEPPLVEVVQTQSGCGRLLLMGVLAALLGAALALAAIFLVNGTLDFQSAAIRAAQDEVLRMEGLVGALDMKVAELEGRLGAIQELDARLTETQNGLRRLSADLDDVRQKADALAEIQGALRQEFTNLREDMDGLADHTSMLDRRLSEAETQIAYLNRRIEILIESIRRFDEFLTGLQTLLNESLDAVPPTPTPWITPETTPTPEPTARETRVPRPQVTVIPLATRTPTP